MVRVAACMNQRSCTMIHAAGQGKGNRPLEFPAKKELKTACTIVLENGRRLTGCKS